jgi:hypothetical protein
VAKMQHLSRPDHRETAVRNARGFVLSQLPFAYHNLGIADARDKHLKARPKSGQIMRNLVTIG